MHRRSLPLLLCLCACTPTGAATDDAKLDELSAKLDATLDDLERIEGRLEAIEAIEAKVDAISEAQKKTRVPPVGPTATAMPLEPAVEDPPKLDPGELEASIACEASRCTIKRALLDKFLDAPATVGRMARVVPTVRGGQTLGYKLFGIRSSSMFNMLGFKNGDMLTAVDGQPLSSLDAAMAAYAKLRGASEFEIAFESREEAKTLTIVIE